MIGYFLMIAVGVAMTLFFIDLMRFIKKPDGHLVIDETADSIYVAIATEPSELVNKRQITLKVIHKDN